MRKYIKEKHLLWKLKHFKLPTMDLFDGDEWFKDCITHRFLLSCKKSELKYVQVLNAISKEEFYFKFDPSVYYINFSKQIIFHHCGDVCDIVSKNKEDIHFLYKDFNNWILEYDREKIEKLFI